MKSIPESSLSGQGDTSSMSVPRAPAAPWVALPRPGAGETIELSEILTALRRHWGLAVIVTVAAFAIGMGFVLFSHMRFESTARLYLGDLEDKGRPVGADGIDLSTGWHGDIGSEIEILTSRSLVTRAVLSAGLNTLITFPGRSPPRYWRWLASMRSESLLDVSAKELTAVDTSLTDRSLAADRVAILFVTDVDYVVHNGGRLVGRGKLGDAVRCEGLTLRLLPGTERGPVAGARYEIEVASVDDVVDAALKTLEVSTPANKSTATGDAIKVANLRFSSRSPRKSAAFLDRLMRGYLEERQSWSTENASAAESFLAGELEKTRQTLGALQGKLAAFRSDYGDVVLDNEAKAMIEQISKYGEQRVASRLEIQSLASVQKQLEKPNPPPEAFMLGEAKDDSVLAGLAGMLSRAEQRLAEAEARYNAAAPELQSERAQVDAQLRAIRSYVSSRLERARDNLGVLDGIIGQQEAKLKTVPSAELGLAQLTRESEVYGAMYSHLLRRQQEAALVKASTVSNNRILDPPDVPYREDTSRLGIGLASAPFGLLIGAMIGVVRTVSSSRFQRSAEVRRQFAEVPVLATVPRLVLKRGRVTPECLEAFRTLRANVFGACHRDSGNVVLFTSPCGGDGKTTCASFLASMLASAGRSVLLVDTGVGKQPHPGSKSDPDRRGLGDVLEGRAAWREVVRQVEAVQGYQFRRIEAGSGASTDLLSSLAMIELIAEISELHDFVLLEAPSYPAMSDTLVLSTFADCVIAVLRLEHTTRSAASDTLRQLSAATLNYGIVLNDARV